ncbi:putative DNA-binding protein [Oceanobacillus alkalisoli]|uniref:putative DNA-binding protein n=1 Tax=Oceanobacillus alkalisoli TaxID=2925113 RepID=UPI001EF057C7|nr:putative DNA-binding protein [Oceanobacillus alkalisoli]MCF3942460.1 putative DNA-binding protein [Oceanobacillus alkalisoli]MCG5103517.1 putative DNA-binding protein [Oceanobacillus alkalisoli]
MLEKTMRVNYLFDFYQDLLTSKQKKYMKLYYLEDLSLSEISEVFSVSRQAVYDNIKRTEAMLESYEEKLNLYEKFSSRTKIINELEQKASSEEIKQLVNKLKELD